MTYINKHGYKGSLLDEVVVLTMTNLDGLHQSFFDSINTFLDSLICTMIDWQVLITSTDRGSV